MIDKYLCRAKRVDNNEWIEGFLVRYGWIGKEKWHIIPSYASALYTFEITPSTICRCTGVKDINGLLIWENDILMRKTTEKFKKYNSMKWEQYGVVKFGEYDFKPGVHGRNTVCFYVEHLKNVPIEPPNYLLGNISPGLNQRDVLDECYPYEVVGNIFDDYERLKI